jgi:hypothetical protein
MLTDSKAMLPELSGPMMLSEDQRGALEMLAGSRWCTGAMLLAHGFNIDMVAGLVRDGLATARRESVKVEGQIIKVARVRITDAGRRAIND